MLLRVSLAYAPFFFFFFFNDTATTEIYTLSLHDALPISILATGIHKDRGHAAGNALGDARSEEHTSELQSQSNLVCRLLLEKKKKKNSNSRCHVTVLADANVKPAVL